MLQRLPEQQSQLKSSDQEASDFQPDQFTSFHAHKGQEERLREEQRVTELQRQVRAYEGEMTALREQLKEFQVQGERLREEKQRVTELQKQLTTKEGEVTTLQEQLNGIQGQEERLREEQRRVTELQRQLTTHEGEMTALRKQLNDSQGLEERLREEQQRVTELRRQLGTNVEDTRLMREQLTAQRKQLNEFQAAGQGELLREKQRGNELQRSLETNEGEIIALREQLNEFQGQGERLREEQQRVTELQMQLTTYEGEMTALREQLNEFQGKGELGEQQVIEPQRLLRINENAAGSMAYPFNEYLATGVQLRPIRVAELPRQMRTNVQELRLIRDPFNDLQGQNERFREQMRQLQSRNVNEEGRELREAPNLRDWTINQNDIQITSQELGRGAWGTVYRGKFQGCEVAVKQMNDKIMSDETRRVFEREVGMASKCRHPCLLQFIGATTDERPLLVTELMDCSLRERLYAANRGGQLLSVDEVLVISLDVARALNYLHQKPKPIIHHDVSCANVLLWTQSGQWRAKLSDYGTANFVR